MKFEDIKKHMIFRYQKVSGDIEELEANEKYQDSDDWKFWIRPYYNAQLLIGKNTFVNLTHVSDGLSQAVSELIEL